MKEIFSLFKNSLSKKEILFVLFSMLCGFLISCEYGITRPASYSLFVSIFGSEYFPYAWLFTVPVNFSVIYLYNCLLPTWGYKKVFVLIALASAAINALTAFCPISSRAVFFFQYVWKDIYILLMFKQLWSMIHSTITQEKAKYLYGLIYACGGLGAIIGGIIPSFFSLRLGSQHLLLGTSVVYLALTACYFAAYSQSNLHFEKKESSFEKGNSSLIGMFKQIASSKLLLFILLIVVFMQISISLVEYQYGIMLKQTIPTLDLRTQYTGRLITIMNVLMMCFQILGGIVIIHCLGVRRTHMLIPLLLLGKALALLIYPSFLFASCAYVGIKVLDYSLFSISREMLYIPMNLDEKFRSKAIIDVFAYRSAKALGAVVIFSLQYLALSSIFPFVGMVSITIFALWISTVFVMFKRYQLLQKT